jgi:hypothetical protein
MGKQEQAKFHIMKNLQNRVNARARVSHHNSDAVVISQTQKVDGASKRKFNGKRANKSSIESSCEMDRQAKRLKALNDRYFIIKKRKVTQVAGYIIIIK